jgi:flavin-dependent dehydrogenase
VRLHSVAGPFRVGNAAGEAHPILGEGISMALQSAFLLCLNLLGAAAGSDLSDAAWQRRAGKRYATEWRRHFVPRLRVAALFANLAMRPAGSEPWMALARRWPGLLTLGARWGGKVSCAVDAGTISFLSRTAVPTFQPFIRSGVTANSGRI